MRFYLRSICELAIEAVVLVRLLVAGRPDADALAAAGNPDQCPDFVEPPDDCAVCDEAFIFLGRETRLTKVHMAANVRSKYLGASDFADWDAELDMEDS